MSADGSFPTSSTATHTHSYLGTLRGLWLWGMLTGQREYLVRVADTYRVTVPKAVLESGFACHDLWKDDPHRGEVGSTSDATQLALWIARDGGVGEHLDDVERLVRARLVPAQIIGSPPIRAADEAKAAAGADEYARLDERIIGGDRRHATRAARRQEAHHRRDRRRTALPHRRVWPHRRAHRR